MNTSCSNFAYLQPITDNGRLFAYYILAPIYITVGFSCHILLLFALYKQSKIQSAYLYQVFQAVTETAETVIRSVNIIFRFATGGAAYGTIPNPFLYLSYSYSFMFYGARIGAYLSNSIITTSLFLSVSMAADRVFALFRPTQYRSINFLRHQLIALFFSVVISFSASVFDCFRSTVLATPSGAYSVTVNRNFVGSQLALILAISIITVQLIGLISLTFLSIALCYLYRTLFVKPKITGVNGVSTQEQLKAKAGEKTLALMTIFECIFKILGVTFPASLYISQYADPATFGCISGFMTVYMDITLMVADLGGFFVVIAVSRGVRQMIRKSIRWNESGSSFNSVVPRRSSTRQI